MMLSVIAAAAPPLVIIVFSSCGDDLCGASPLPAVSDCAGPAAEPSDDVVSGFEGFAAEVVVAGRVAKVDETEPVT